MSTLQEVQSAIRELDWPDRYALLKDLSNELNSDWTGLERDPDVCGGSIRIMGTRIPVWLLVEAKRNGASDQLLLEAYPTLTTIDLDRAWNYADTHQEEINWEIRENELA